MNLTLHIVRKDIVRMRVWIACWVALLLVPIVIGAMFIGKNPLADPTWTLPDKIFIITLVEVLVGYFLTILVIQEDSIVGTRQFWLTRPISRGRLLCAKAISAFVIVGLVPIAVSLPWWLWCSLGVTQMAGAAAETLLILVIAMLPAAVVAVLTDSFARALLWTVALVTVVIFGAFFFTVTTGTTVQNEHEMPLIVTRSAVAIIAVAAEMAAIVIVQFLVRRRGWWLGAAGALMAITLIGATQWRWSWISGEPVEHHAERASGVTVKFNRALAGPVVGNKYRPDGVPVQRVESQWVVSGIARERSIVGAAAKQRWTWPSGTTVGRFEQFHSFSGDGSVLGLQVATDPETERSKGEWLQRRTKRQFAPGEFHVETAAWLPPSVVARMATEPPKFEARMWWQAVHPELQLEIPLAPGRWIARNGHGIGIERVERDADTTTITFVATRPVLITPMLFSMAEWYRHFAVDGNQWWALFDRVQGRVLYGFNEGHSDKPRWLVVSGVKIEWRTHVSTRPGVLRNGKWVRMTETKSPISFAVFTMHEDALFSREVKVERFQPVAGGW
jgi:hypothetical protein